MHAHRLMNYIYRHYYIRIRWMLLDILRKKLYNLSWNIKLFKIIILKITHSIIINKHHIRYAFLINLKKLINHFPNFMPSKLIILSKNNLKIEDLSLLSYRVSLMRSSIYNRIASIISIAACIILLNLGIYSK